LQLSVPLPANSTTGFLETSPDGQRLLVTVYRAGKTQIYLRALNSPELQPLSGTDNARTPFWSPDSRFIGFFAEGTLKVIPAAGGPARVLCSETGLGDGGTWSPSGGLGAKQRNRRGEGRTSRPDSQYSDRMTTLEAALERIVAVAKPDRVILFGSAARGTAGPHSDVDFLVIKRGVTSRRRLAQTIYRALVGIRASVDVVVVTPEDVESLKDGVGTIVGPAMREGREVYAA
jgi:predicted nucleotidyltransferase